MPHPGSTCGWQITLESRMRGGNSGCSRRRSRRPLNGYAGYRFVIALDCVHGFEYRELCNRRQPRLRKWRLGADSSLP